MMTTPCRPYFRHLGWVAAVDKRYFDMFQPCRDMLIEIVKDYGHLEKVPGVFELFGPRKMS